MAIVKITTLTIE